MSPLASPTNINYALVLIIGIIVLDVDDTVPVFSANINLTDLVMRIEL